MYEENWATSIRFDRFYPLVAYETQHFAGGNSNRRVVMNPFSQRFPRSALVRLYARQVGKLLSRRMKPLMDLPYSISCVFEDPAAEAEYQHHAWPYFSSHLSIKRRPIEVDADALEMAEEEV